MNIEINRVDYYDYCTIGNWLTNGAFSCYTLEDKIRDKKIKGITAISEDTYKIALRQSPKFSKHFYWNDTLEKLIEAKDYKVLKDKKGWKIHDVLWVTNVPNYEFILIHWGNVGENTDGCLLVGNMKGELNEQKAILDSKKAYIRIYTMVMKALKKEEVFITYKNIKPKIV